MPTSLRCRTGPFASRNTRLYVLFTTLYNARAYYPILAIFFTDLGLTLEQYVLLNACWAASIFLLEVPSGAIADTIGRKKLLVTSAAIMVVEMALLLAAPAGGGSLLFAICMLNRLLSGASEAAASGADEAIAYDSLPEADRNRAWQDVLAAAMRWRAVGFVAAMTLGGLLYDLTWLSSVFPAAPRLDPDLTRRLPVALVFLQALGCLAVALRFDEKRAPHPPVRECLRNSLHLTLRTARFAFGTTAIAAVLMAGLLIDSVIRNFATINSEYYRLIKVPEWTFGLIGSAVGVAGWFIPGIARAINRRFRPLPALGIAGVVALVTLAALARAWPVAGLVPAALLMTLLGYVGFTISAYLHSVARSDERATLLSVKGLTFNVAYGIYSLTFSALVAGFGRHADNGTALRSALQAQVWLMAALSLVCLLWILHHRRQILPPTSS